MDAQLFALGAAGGGDPFAKPVLAVDEHPLVWSLQDVLKGRDTDVSGCKAWVDL